MHEECGMCDGLILRESWLFELHILSLTPGGKKSIFYVFPIVSRPSLFSIS